ncbi:unnamed protein product [Alternaria alternata]
MFVALFSQRALGDWKTRSLEWQQSGRLGKQKKRWTPKEKEDAKLSAVEAMKPEHRPIVAPQESSTRLTTAGQTKSATERQAKNAANKYTWSHDEARSAFEAAYVRHALELHERRLAQYPDGKLPRIKISDKLDILGHVTKELHTLFDDEKLPLKLQRLFTQGVSVGGAGGSDDSHAQGSTATKTFQTTINPKEGRRLEDIPDHYPLGYNSEGESGFSGMSDPQTKSPSASELESDKRKGKGKAKATHSSPNYRAHESSPSDNEYHPGDFLTEEADRTERREQARVAERNQEAARMHMEENRTRMEAARQQPYIQSNLQPQQARVATKPVPSTTSKSPATGDTRVAAGKQRAAKVINPNKYPTVAEYPPGYNSSGSSNPPNTPPITNDQPYYDMMNQDFTTHHWAVNRSNKDGLSALSSPKSSREQSPAPRSSGTSPHVANQSPTSRGTGNEQRSRATSKTSSKGSSDGSAFMADVFDFSAASTHTPPRSTGAPQPIPASHAQHVGPSTHTTVGKAPNTAGKTPTTAGKTTTTAGKTPASQKTVAASKRPTESSASSSSVKEDKGKKSLKSSASSSGPKEDKGKKPPKKK